MLPASYSTDAVTCSNHTLFQMRMQIMWCIGREIKKRHQLKGSREGLFHTWQIDKLLQTKAMVFMHFPFDFSICIAIGRLFLPHDEDDKSSVCGDCILVYLCRD